MNEKKGRLDVLNRLSVITSNKGISILNPPASPGSHCPMHTALAIVRGVKGISTLVVGIPECGYYSRYVVRNKAEEKELHHTYVLDENEVVFGCREGVMEALHEMNREGAEAILVIMTCIPELIGEDIKSIVHEMQDMIDSKILPVSIPHYKHNGYETGYTYTMQSFINLMEERTTNPSQVNILGNVKGADVDTIRTVLEGKFSINEMGQPLNLESFRAAPAGKVNLVFSRFAVSLAEEMEQKYKIPWISFYDSYTTEDINACYKQLEDILEVNINNRFEPVRKAISEKEEYLFHTIAGIKYISTDAGIDTLAIADYLKNLGFEPELLHLEEYERRDKVIQERILESNYNPYVCYVSNIQDLDRYIGELEARFSLGGVGNGLQEKGIKGIPIRMLGGLTGYDRTLKLLELLTGALITN